MSSVQQSAFRFVCPHCKSREISENNSVNVRIRVSDWTKDGQPADFAYPWSVVEDTMEIASDKPRYHCDRCEREFEEALGIQE
jgi:transposase-like protein